MFKRVAALVGVIFLVLIYITTLVAAIIGSEFSGKILAAALISTIIVPVMIHLLLMMKNAREGRSVLDETYHYKEKSDK
ncbi:hypothetical protein QYZ88_003235 [Lachnospiraceae bacterium C1.1]|nr:hypothetical protein [Lachnospiraceae bacterium C1.1]